MYFEVNQTIEHDVDDRNLVDWIHWEIQQQLLKQKRVKAAEHTNNQ